MRFIPWFLSLRERAKEERKKVEAHALDMRRRIHACHIRQKKSVRS
jgi:hypothetical protein